MLKAVGYIGYGFVGKACHVAFEHNAQAIIIDPKFSTTKIEDLKELKPELVFVCINAPTLEDRTVDVSVICDVFQQLTDIKYEGLVVLKSTIPPQIAADLCEKYTKLRYIYSPEFLRESTWKEDALNPHVIIIGGPYHDCRELMRFYERHSHVRQPEFRVVDYKEAALLKYTINSFLASKVVFMNQIYQLYSDLNGKGPAHPVLWKEFTDILSLDPRFGNSHLSVPGPDGQFGYGGSCFPKDVKALIGFDKENRLSLLRETELANTKIRLIGDIDSKS